MVCSRVLNRRSCRKLYFIKSQTPMVLVGNAGGSCPRPYTARGIEFDVALYLLMSQLKRHSRIVWDPGRFAGSFHGGNVRRLGNPAGASALGLTPWRTWGCPTNCKIVGGLHSEGAVLNKIALSPGQPLEIPWAYALMQEALPGVVEPGCDLLLCTTPRHLHRRQKKMCAKPRIRDVANDENIAVGA
jgi:hypothetical protein